MACVTLLLASRFLFAGSQVNARTIIEQSVAANARDWEAAPQFECFQTTREPGQPSKTYHELMILGSPYEELVADNGKPLSQQQQDAEKQKLHDEIARRQEESSSRRSDRIGRYEKDRDRDHLLMQQLSIAFTFTLVGSRTLNGHAVYLLNAVPKPDYQPPNMEAKVLKGMRGRLWIDQKTFQWLRVEAEVVQPVSIEGFLAEVEPGTRFELEKGPVTDGIWLPTHFAMKSDARVLHFFTRRSAEDDRYFNYQKAPDSNKLRPQ